MPATEVRENVRECLASAWETAFIYPSDRLLAPDTRSRWAVQRPEVVRRHSETDRDHNRAQDGAAHPTGDQAPQIATDEAADRHRNSVGPVDRAFDDKHQHSHASQAP